MKFKNFRNLRVLPSGRVTAEVDVECKYLWVFPVEATCVVFQEYGGARWRWLKDGSIIEGYVINNLEKAYRDIKEIHNAK